MKFCADVRTLADAFSLAAKAASQKSGVAILANVLMRRDGDALTIRATDLDAEIQVSVSVEWQDDGECTVPAKLFADYLANLGPSLIEVSGSDTRITAKNGKTSYDFHTLPPGDFPAPLHGDEKPFCIIDGNVLRSLLESVVFAASDQEARGVIKSVLFKLDRGDLEVVATDGYRLARGFAAVDRDSEDPETILIPKTSLTGLGRAFADQSVRITTIRGRVRFSSGKAGGATYTVRAGEGTFPNYSQVIPERSRPTFTVKTADLRSAIRRASLATDGSRGVHVMGESGAREIEIRGEGSGTATERVSVQGVDDAFRAYVNAGYLGEILDRCVYPEVAVQMANQVAPMLITAAEYSKGSSGAYVLMPLRYQAPAKAA